MQIFEKKFFKNGYHGYKNIDTLYLSKDARWPIVAIIHRNMNSYIAFHFAPRHLTSGDLEGHKRSYSLNLQTIHIFSISF